MSNQKSSTYVTVKNRPSTEVLHAFETSTITIPIHEGHLSLEIDSQNSNESNLIEYSLALHLGLSIVEHVLLRCQCTHSWWKDHFYPTNHILFKEETVSLSFGLILWTSVWLLLDFERGSAARDSFRLAQYRSMARDYFQEEFTNSSDIARKKMLKSQCVRIVCSPWRR